MRHVERYRLDRPGRQPARLYVSTAPSVAPRRGVLLNLTVRGGLSGDLGTFLDDAREDIVSTFDGITAPEFHDRWEKR